jgi:hypothetical protein
MATERQSVAECTLQELEMMSQEVLRAGAIMSRGESVDVQKFEEISFEARAWSSE